MNIPGSDLKRRVIAEADKIPGWTATHDLQILWELCEKYVKPGGSIVELGTWKGRSTYVLASYCKYIGAICYTIDTFSGCVEPDSYKNKPDNLGSYNEAVVNPNFIDIAKNNLNGLPVLFFKGDSAVIADSLQDNSFDLCFIDGDHNHPRVDSDIKNFLKKVKVGGCLSGHDLCNPEGDVFEALNSVIGSNYKDMIAYDDTGVPYAATTIWIHEVKK